MIVWVSDIVCFCANDTLKDETSVAIWPIITYAAGQIPQRVTLVGACLTAFITHQPSASSTSGVFAVSDGVAGMATAPMDFRHMVARCDFSRAWLLAGKYCRDAGQEGITAQGV